MPHPSATPVSRRRFLEQASLAAAAGAILPASPTAGFTLPDAILPVQGRNLAAATRGPVRVRGRVRAGAAGVAHVAVTDGQAVAETSADGSFTLVADGHQPFVYLSLPDGYELPTNPTGTARFYERLVADAQGNMDVAFDLEKRDGSAERHQFLVLPDTQTQDAADMALLHGETVPDVAAWTAARDGSPVFGVSVGDIMFDNLALYPEYERAVAAMGLPFFQVVGNHDLDFKARSAELTVETFMRHFGPPYYSFDLGAVHYVVLQDVLWHGTGYVGYIDERQLRWLEADLSRIEDGRPVVVFQHIPAQSLRWQREGQSGPSASTSVNNRAALYALLSPFKAHIISGHTHENEHVFENGVHEHIHGTVCGAWWSGPICHDGTPSGYGIFDVRGEELQWIYKATGKPVEHQMRLYAPGSDPAAPDELVANVWNWDPAWRVEWSADGTPRGPMARRVGHDPLSLQLHKGPELPARRPWVEPARTGHLFYAAVGPDVKEVTVQATDRFGRMFTERWRR